SEARTRGEPHVRGRGPLPRRRQGDRHPGERHDQDPGAGGKETPATKKAAPPRPTTDGQLGLIEPTLVTAPCVPAVREAVREWREHGYKKTSATTAALLAYW